MSSALGRTATVDGGGVDTSLGFGLWDALDAVGAAFVLEAWVCAFALDLEDDFLDAADSGVVKGEDGCFPSVVFGESLIHAEEFVGEEAGFFAAGAGSDFEDGVGIVGFVARDESDLDLADEFVVAQALVGDDVAGHVDHVRVRFFVDDGFGVGDLF